MIQKKREEFAQRKLENKSNDTDVTDHESESILILLKYTLMWLIYCLNYLEKHSKVFLDTLFELNEVGANFSDDDIRDEVVTMMIGVSKY